MREAEAPDRRSAGSPAPLAGSTLERTSEETPITPTPPSPDRLPERIAAALASADLESMRVLLAPDARWGPPEDPDAGCHDRDEILAWYGQARDAGARAQVTEVVASGDQVLVGLLVTGTEAAAGGAPVERWQVMSIRDGRVADIRGFGDRESAEARIAAPRITPGGAGTGLEGHEGYPAAVLAGGAELSTWTGEDDRPPVGYRAVCECGWRGSQVHPGAQYPDDEARRRIMSEWEGHAESLRLTLERVAGLPELAPPLARARQAARDALDRGATVAEVARALGVSDELVGALLGPDAPA
ncbi:MAG: nuclear transport factor 2 family protein [Acidimicrobiales bacterium]